MNTLTQQIEALLFVAGEAVEKKELLKILEIESAEQLHAALQALVESLAGHGITLIETHSHVQLVTSPEVAPFLSAYTKDTKDQLSKAASETLAIIAYRGPISRSDIDTIRGVDSRRMVRSLNRRGLVTVIRKPKQPAQYDVTEQFLAHVGVTSKDQLPQFETLSNHDAIVTLLDQEEQRL